MRRPFSVTLLGWGVLMIAAVNLIRFVQAFQQRDFLASLPGVSPIYIAASGLVWAVAGLPIGWGLWRGVRGIPFVTRIFSAAYFFYFWADRLVVSPDGLHWTSKGFQLYSANVLKPFTILSTIILFGLVYWILSRVKVKAFFGEIHDDKPKNPTVA